MGLRTVITYQEEEQWLYDKIHSRSHAAIHVKDILIDYYNGKLVYVDDKKQTQKVNSHKNEMCIFDRL